MGWPPLSAFGRGLPGSESFPSMQQRGRHLRGRVPTRYASRSCIAPPSLPTRLDNLAGTAMTNKHMHNPYPAGVSHASCSKFPCVCQAKCNRSWHSRESGRVAKYSDACRKVLSIMDLSQKSTLPIVSRSWQSGKVLQCLGFPFPDWNLSHLFLC